MKRASVVLVVADDGRVLAVSRPDSPLRYALPGGGVELGESYAQAARRELWEETGIVADQLVQVHADKHDGTNVVAFVEVGRPAGQLRSSHEGWARWVHPSVITTYPEFTREVLRGYSQLKHAPQPPSRASGR